MEAARADSLESSVYIQHVLERIADAGKAGDAVVVKCGAGTSLKKVPQLDWGQVSRFKGAYAVTEEKLNILSGISWPLQFFNTVQSQFRPYVVVVYNTQHVIEGYDLAPAMQGSRDDHFHCAAFPQQLATIRGTAAHPLLKLARAEST
jgi:hypothetical protein